MKKYILFLVSLLFISSCGNADISSENLAESYDAETLTLDISSKNLSSLPDFSLYIGESWIQDVETIDISDNKLESIESGSLDMFTSLSSINLESNSFKTGSDVNIPTTVKKLFLSDNMLDDIAGFSKYTQLTRLSLNNNNLEDLDLAELGGFKKLALLEVEGNNVSPELLEKINIINTTVKK